MSVAYVTTNASGAVLGLLGAQVMELVIYARHYTRWVVTVVVMGLIIGLHVTLGLLPLTDNWGNLAGLITGAVLGLLLLLLGRKVRGVVGWGWERDGDSSLLI